MNSFYPIEAVINRFKGTSEYEVEVAVKNWLRHAPARVDAEKDEPKQESIKARNLYLIIYVFVRF